MSKYLTMMSVSAVVVLAACSPKDAAKTDSAKVAQAGAAAAAAAAPASRGAFDPATHTATIYAKDYAFESPDSISAGLTNFHLVNEGQTLHHVQLVRLDSGKTAADLQAAMKNPGPPPAWAVSVGGPNAPDPGSTSDAAVDLKEGNYVVLCFVDIPEHVPHFAKGMVRPLKVVAATGTPAAAPTADVTVTLADYNFIVKGALTAGKHIIKVDNKGPQEHELEIIRLAPGKTVKDPRSTGSTRPCRVRRRRTRLAACRESRRPPVASRRSISRPATTFSSASSPTRKTARRTSSTAW